MSATVERTDAGDRHTLGLFSDLRLAEWTGALGSLVVALLLFTRFSLYGALSRDEAIYAYGGQQMAHGVPPYASIFDPKAPLGTIICGIAASLARALGLDMLLSIRLAFFVCSVLTVVAIYLLVLQLWRSVPGALAAAAVFASFTGFAQDALAGPDAKTPGILFAVVCMWLAAKRRWFWAAFLGGMAFLVWQPLVFFPFVAVLGALVSSPRRWRALLISLVGAATPVAATALYFTVVGAFGKFVESAFLFPLIGVHRTDETLFERLSRIVAVIRHSYGFDGLVYALGLALVLLLIANTLITAGPPRRNALRDPLVLIVGVTLVGEFAYAFTDFQGAPDVYPLLPYAAVGIGGAAALLVRGHRQPVTMATGVLALALVLTVISAATFTVSPHNERRLHQQWATACAVKRVLLPGTPLYSLGDPKPLVLTELRNPDRFIYLGSGVDWWRIEHDGGFANWTSTVRHSRASVIIIQSWGGLTWPDRMTQWLDDKSGYHAGYIGKWRVYVAPRAFARAGSEGVAITDFPTKWPQTVDGHKFRQQECDG